VPAQGSGGAQRGRAAEAEHRQRRQRRQRPERQRGGAAVRSRGVTRGGANLTLECPDLLVQPLIAAGGSVTEAMRGADAQTGAFPRRGERRTRRATPMPNRGARRLGRARGEVGPRRCPERRGDPLGDAIARSVVRLGMRSRSGRRRVATSEGRQVPTNAGRCADDHRRDFGRRTPTRLHAGHGGGPTLGLASATNLSPTH
jgi:hypothetical protein